MEIADWAMLVANFNSERIDAFSAQKGPTYYCPECEGQVILKKGPKVVHHFAHKPPVTCNWAKGETRAHMEAKAVLANAFKTRGLLVDMEIVVKALPNDRRTDVMVWSPKGEQIAFELQHTAISREEIEARASSYARAGIAQIWIPFINKKVWKEGRPRAGGWFVDRYSPRDFERWVHGLGLGKGMWMYEPNDKTFWLGHMATHRIYVEEKTWYSEGGEENYSGGFWKYSKRYRELTLEGPFKAEGLRIKVTRRKAYSKSGHHWPAGRIANLVPASELTAKDSAIDITQQTMN